MKKTIFIILSSTVITALIIFLGLFAYKNYRDNKEEKLIEKVGVNEVKEIKYTLPNFTILINGIYDTTISKDDILDLKTYLVSAVMNDSIYKEFNTYEAVKLSDILELYKIEDYKNIVFKSNGNLQVKFSREEINDNFYLSFSKNNISYPSSEPVNLLCPDYNLRYNLTNIVRIDFE